jgi:hypothetical protein
MQLVHINLIIFNLQKYFDYTFLKQKYFLFLAALCFSELKKAYAIKFFLIGKEIIFKMNCYT